MYRIVRLIARCAGGLLDAAHPAIAQSGSVGIIGGADGPTAIFVTTRVNPLAYIVAGVLVAAFIALLFLRKK